MRTRSKALSCLLSVLLVVSFSGFPAYALDDSIASSSSSADSSSHEIGSSSKAEDSVGEVSGSAASNLSAESATGNPSAEENHQGESAVAETSDDARLSEDASNVIEFVYLDESCVSVGQEQNIAIGFVDSVKGISSAKLCLEKKATSEKLEFEASAIMDDAVLFTTSFGRDSDASAYDLVSIDYTAGNERHVVSLQSQSGDYLFDVVRADTAAQLEQSADGGSDSDVSAYAITNEGNLQAAASVAQAIDLADSGSSDGGAGESVVDEQAIQDGALDNPSYDQDSAVEETDDSAPDGISAAALSLLGIDKAYADAVKSREDYLIVALDPGHGGSDGGSSAYGLNEKTLNWKIASSCYNALREYTGVYPYLTRNGDEYVGLQERVDRAVAIGADVFVCLHCNAGGGTGAEVWVPNSSSYLYNETHVVGEQLGNKILDRITKLGLNNRGTKIRNCTNDARYPDGSLEDYYTVIASSREEGIPGIIVEHAFVDNASDASKLSDDSFLNKLGKEDATGIANQYGLVSDSAAKSSALVQAVGHSSHVGWLANVYDKKVVGTTGKCFGLEAFQARLQNAASSAGGITYRAYVGNGWQGWASNGETAGTTGKGVALQAVQMKLTGDAAKKYDVYYRAHVANVGWLGWAKNGASAGSVGYGYNAEAIEIAVVAKGAAAPGDTTTPFKTKTVPADTSIISYQAHVSNIGWQGSAKDGSTAGTTGKAYAIEALKVNLNNRNVSGGVRYNLHCANIGWQGWRSDGSVGGTTGQSRQTEAIRLELTGEAAKQYDIYYRVHCESFGWLDWAKNGEMAGSEGYGYRMEAIQIKLVKKGSAAPGSTATPNKAPLVAYQSHVSGVGWQSYSRDGAQSGTTGAARAIEAVTAYLPTQAYSGSISYNAHCANIGWQGWKSSGKVAGTTGQSRQMEAIQVKLTGEMANHYDVYYRVHSQDYGWLGWAKNGEVAGTVGYGKRMEAYQVVLVAKGASAPGSTQRASVVKGSAVSSASSIMGASKTSAKQMAAYYKSKGKAYPSSVYASKGASTIDQFCSIVEQEAVAEGVRPEVLFCQAMKETGWLQFGGSVKPQQCNFGGLGAVTSSAEGASFSNVRIGLRAQAQHLKAYASTAALENPCVDPRFDLVTRGVAPKLEDLNGRWAVPGTGYGEGILAMIGELYKR